MKLNYLQEERHLKLFIIHKKAILKQSSKQLFIWCPRRDLNPHGFPHDFESCASANSATRATHHYSN